jgi:hypothetical protein
MVTMYGFSFSFQDTWETCPNPQESFCSSSEESTTVGTRLPSILSESSKTNIQEMMEQLFALQWKWVVDHLSTKLNLLSSLGHKLVEDRTWKKEVIEDLKHNFFIE